MDTAELGPSSPKPNPLVERIARVVPKPPSKSQRVFDLPPAPTLYPTEEEFKDPVAYIAAIRPQVERFGICKVVPPPSFTPTFAPDIENITFQSRKQRLNASGATVRASLNYIENLRLYHQQNGQKMTRPPICAGRSLDLYQLHLQVSTRGGNTAVTMDKKWADVGRNLGYNTLSNPTLSTQLRTLYEKFILPYEDYINGTESKGNRRKRKSAPTSNSDKGYDSDDCGVCHSSKSLETLLVCEICNVGFHLKCINPPLDSIPEHDWYCAPCLKNRDIESGFEEGETYTLADFCTRADKFRQEYLAGLVSQSDKKPQLPAESLPAEELENMIEKEFWRLVEDPFNDVTVEYGADLNSQQYGSGFPTTERHPTDPMARHPWNLTNLPILPQSLLSYLKSPISGMTVPWLYIGMCFSNFCWHAEDHYTYSINYHHWGDTKTWYGIPANSASSFEVAFRREAPKIFEKHPDLLFHLATTLSPDTLLSHRVDVYALDQRQGEFVITFPRAYHAGFNHGLNCNEAANFAPAEWLPQGLECIAQYRRFRRLPAFCHHELLMQAANGTHDISLATSLIPYLKEMKQWGDDLKTRIMRFSQHYVSRPHTKEVPQCSICHEFCYLLSVTCHCQGHAGQVACLEHSPDLCECVLSERILIQHVTQAEIEQAIARLINISNPGAAWAKRCESILRDEQRPRLSQLMALVADARSLPFTPPEEASQLAKFTSRCLAWKELVDTVLQAYTSKEPDDLSQLPPPTQLASHIQGLLDQAQNLPVQFDEMDLFATLGYWVKSFCASARVLLSNPAATLDRANELQNQGAQIGLIFEETEQLDRLVDQLQWCEDARTLISGGGDISRSAEELLAAAPQPANDQMNEWLVALRTHLPHQPTPKTSSPIRTPTRPLPKIAPQAPPPVEDGLFASVRYLMDQAKCPNLPSRPSTAKLYSIMERLKNANRTEAPFQELRRAYLDVDRWLKQCISLLSVKSSVVQGSLLSQLSKALNQLQLQAKPKGYFGCVCFGSSKELNTVVCQVCSVLYHNNCVQPTMDSSGMYTCPLCSPGAYRPIRVGRPCSSDLLTLAQSGLNLPFIPPELNVMLEMSKFIQVLSSHSTTLVQDPQSKLDNLKDLLRLLEGLDIALQDEAHALHRRIMCSYPSMPSRPILPPASSLLQHCEKPPKRTCTSQTYPIPGSSSHQVSHSPHSGSHPGFTSHHPQYTQAPPNLPSQAHLRQPSHLSHGQQSHTGYSQHPSYRDQYQQRHSMYPSHHRLDPPITRAQDSPASSFSVESLIGPNTKESSSKSQYQPEVTVTSPSPRPYSSRYLPDPHVGGSVNPAYRYSSQTNAQVHTQQNIRPSAQLPPHGINQRQPTIMYAAQPRRNSNVQPNFQELLQRSDLSGREKAMAASSYQQPQYYSQRVSHPINMSSMHSGGRPPMVIYPSQSRPGQFQTSTYHGQHPMYGGTSANPSHSQRISNTSLNNTHTIVAPHLRPPTQPYNVGAPSDTSANPNSYQS